MKIITQFSILLLILGLVFAPAMSYASSAPASSTPAESTLSKKELRVQKLEARKQQILEKRLGKIEKLLEKKATKHIARPKASSDKWKPAVLLWGAALLLTIVGAVITVGTAGTGIGIGFLFSLLAGLAWLAGTVFWIWFLIEVLG